MIDRKPGDIPPAPFLPSQDGAAHPNIPPAPVKPGEIPAPPMPGQHPSPWSW